MRARAVTLPSGSPSRVALAAAGGDQPQEHLDRGGLAGAVGAQEAEHLAALDAQREVFDGHFAVEDLAQVVGFDGRSHISANLAHPLQSQETGLLRWLRQRNSLYLRLIIRYLSGASQIQGGLLVSLTGDGVQDAILHPQEQVVGGAFGALLQEQAAGDAVHGHILVA